MRLDLARLRLVSLPLDLPAPGTLPPPPPAITTIRVEGVLYREPELVAARLTGDGEGARDAAGPRSEPAAGAGAAAGRGGAPVGGRSGPPAAGFRAAAALVLLVPDDTGEAHLVLMKRTDDGGPHARQIAFPGGSVEPDDTDEAAAALREAEEEVGLDAAVAGVEIVGRLERIVVAASGFVLDPFVAIAARTPELTANPVEVGAILVPPLAAFLPGARIVEREETIRGVRVRYGGYPVDGGVVWGATARVLGQLGAVIGPG